MKIRFLHKRKYLLLKDAIQWIYVRGGKLNGMYQTSLDSSLILLWMKIRYIRRWYSVSFLHSSRSSLCSHEPALCNTGFVTMPYNLSVRHPLLDSLSSYFVTPISFSHFLHSLCLLRHTQDKSIQFLVHIQEVSGSILDPKTRYEEILCRFSHFLQANCRMLLHTGNECFLQLSIVYNQPMSVIKQTNRHTHAV
jgi:hypothetical protein